MNESLFGDPVRIKQILTNLLGNSVKFTSDGEVELRAELVRSEDVAVVVRFVVRDTGIGISQKHLERIFMPFTQADQSTSRRYGGTGLGLSICRYLSELVGGQITVQSEEGKGSTFFLELPLMREANVRQTLSASGSLKPALISNVLVVEDDPFLQQLAGRQMQRLGVSARVARDADEAIAYLKIEKFDIIFMDCHMPGTDGYALTSIIRASLDWSNVPIVAMTAGAMIGDYERCMASGMDDYLSKPYTLKQLEIMLRKWTGQRSVNEQRLDPLEKPAISPASSVDATALAEPSTGGSADAKMDLSKSATSANGTNGAEQHLPQVGSDAMNSGTDAAKAGTKNSIDLDKLRTTYGESACDEILDVFFQSSKDVLVELKLACEKRSAHELKELAHRLKGSCLMAFMEPLSEVCARMEQEAKADEPDWRLLDRDMAALLTLMDVVADDCARPRITSSASGA